LCFLLKLSTAIFILLSSSTAFLLSTLPTQEVKAEQPNVSDNPTLRDVESTAKALEKGNGYANYSPEGAKQKAEAYHKAKLDGSNPELVKAVEQLLSKEQAQNEAGKLTAEVREPVGEALPESKEQGVETTVSESIEPVSERTTEVATTVLEESGRTPVTLSGSTEPERQLAIEQRKKETNQTPLNNDRNVLLLLLGWVGIVLCNLF